MMALGFLIGTLMGVGWGYLLRRVWCPPGGHKKLGQLGGGHVASALDFELKPVLIKYDAGSYIAVRRRLTMGDE